MENSDTEHQHTSHKYTENSNHSNTQWEWPDTTITK